MGRWGCLIGVLLLIIAAGLASSVETLGDMNLNIAIVCLLIGIVFLIIGLVSFSLRKRIDKSEVVRKPHQKDASKKEPSDHETIHCPKCDSEISKTDKICPKCGGITWFWG